MSATYVSSRQRLLGMPEIFSVAELAMVMGVPRTEASQYLWRWRSAHLVSPFGGKSGIVINLVRRPDALADGSIWERALLKAMPSAIIAGYEVLAESGVTTQVTHQRYVLVSNTDAMYQVEGAEIHRRPIPWLNRLVREGGVVNDDSGSLAPRLRPGAALADMALYAQSKPDPDDIDMGALEAEDVELFRRLTRAEAFEDAEPRRRASRRASPR